MANVGDIRLRERIPGIALSAQQHYAKHLSQHKFEAHFPQHVKDSINDQNAGVLKMLGTADPLDYLPAETVAFLRKLL